MPHIVSLKWFGAIGDGVADDSLPFQRMVEYVNNFTGAITIEIPKGTYCIKWDEAVPVSHKYFQNCTGVSIIGQGAIIKIMDDAKCGLFGSPGNIIHINEGWGFRFDQCRKVYVRGLKLEGNVLKLDYGLLSHPGDGRCTALYFQGCEDVLVENCVANNFGTDGVKVTPNEALTISSRRISLRNISTSGNRHAGIDINGCSLAEIVNCEFRNTGKPLLSGTGAGGIIEPAGFPCEQIVFTNCVFEGNKKMGFICDDPHANKPDEDKPDEDKPDEDKPDEDKPDEDKPDESVKDILLLSCRFIGLDGDSWSALTRRRTVRFIGCRFFGAALLYGEALGCHFENDDTYYVGPDSDSNVCLYTDGDVALKLRDCTFVAKGGRRLIELRSSTTPESRKIIEGCTFIVDGNGLGAATTHAGTISGKAVLRQCNFLKTGDDPAGHYYIDFDLDSAFDVDCTCNSPKLVLRNTSSRPDLQESWRSAHHLEERLPSGDVTPYLKSKLLQIVDLDDITEATKHFSAAAQPLTGDWTQGSIVWNSTPTEDNLNQMVLIGWVCTQGGDFAGGSPPQFREMWVSWVSPAR